jgi:hypothetical protein
MMGNRFGWRKHMAASEMGRMVRAVCGARVMSWKYATRMIERCSCQRCLEVYAREVRHRRILTALETRKRLLPLIEEFRRKVRSGTDTRYLTGAAP